MRSLPWTTVALAAIGTGGFIGIFYLSDTTGRTALIGVVSAIGTAITAYITNRRFSEVKTELDKVKQHVNGNTRALIEKIPEPERPNVVPQID